MLHWRSAIHLSRRLLHIRHAKTELLLDQLKTSTNKYQIFQTVVVNRPILTLEHVTCAMDLLWQFHKTKPNELTNLKEVRGHPEFLSLCTVVENNFDLLNDSELVNVLNIVTSFQVDTRSHLVQQLVTEGWKRLQRLDLSSLSTFAACLRKQNLTTSPLMGQIANIVDLCLDNLEDPVILFNFIGSLYAVSSPRLQERLVRKTESSLENLDASHLENVVQLLEVFSRDNYNLSVMKKCDRLFQKHASSMDLQTICTVMKLYQFLHFNNSEFIIEAQSKLMEEVNRCDHPGVFADLFVVLSPNVLSTVRERLEAKLMSFADEMSFDNLLNVLKKMAQTECTNTELIQKICSQLKKHLEVCTPGQLCSIVKAVLLLDFNDNELHTELQVHLNRRILSSFIPSDVTLMLRALFLLNPNQINEEILSKLHDILAQCKFQDLSHMTSSMVQLLQSAYTPNKKAALNKIIQELNSLRIRKVSEIKCMDSLLHEMRDKEVTLRMYLPILKATLETCQRLMHQLNWNNIAEFSILVLRTNTHCSPLLDKIATVTMDNLKKIHPAAVYPILRVFSYFNCDPPQGKDFFDACIQHVLKNMDSLSPHLMVLTTYSLSMAGYFPEELIKAIFSMDFLLRFDAQLDALNHTKNLRQLLMELNRSVCLEHPEYGVPWFHENYCQRLLKRDLEYILDKEKKPIAYIEEDPPSSDSSVCEPDRPIQENKPLPAGARRVAVEFYNQWAFLRDSYHLKGAFAIKKKHLEILGYDVIQIPYYEWNSENLGTKVAWTNYLRNKIFTKNV
uniref:RAP domain-containing protein n=1 Tax=Pyxicephalus adspersus TaxID=30357 RepID=A0AAV3A9I8_PYXAD|nr:TPA: hypothetical protein GDO54_015583 [Pyxicephalus adspersus]